MGQRLLSCLTLASEALDAVAMRAICRWLPDVSKRLPGASSQARRARGRPRSDLDCTMGGVCLQQAENCYSCPMVAVSDCDDASHVVISRGSVFGISTKALVTPSQPCNDLDVEMADMSESDDL